jgi:hypothetical protein
METDQYVSVNELRKSLIDEIIKSVGLPRTPFWQKVFSPIFWLPTDRFSRFGSNFDKLITKSGFNKAINNALTFFVGGVEVHGGNNIPKKGPLLVVSNHPGTYDAVVIAANLPRDDVKIVSSGIPFIQKMRNADRVHARGNERAGNVVTRNRDLLEQGTRDHYSSGNCEQCAFTKTL